MKVAVVGSGPTGVAAATALLAHGATVELLDVGHEPEPASAELGRRLREGPPTAELLQELKRSVPKAQQGVVAAARMLFVRDAPANMIEKSRLGSAFAFRGVAEGIPVDGAPLPRSLAQGGLSNVWGATCYPLRAEDYAAGWPIPEREMAAHYRVAAGLLGLDETADDLAAIYPVYSAEPDGSPPAIVSRTAGGLIDQWTRRADALHALGVHFGRTRSAVRKRSSVAPEAATDADIAAGRVGCQQCGLCLSGCPWDAIYRSTRTLVALRSEPRFTYRPGFFVGRVRETDRGSFVDGDQPAGPYDAVFLAGGPLSSLRIAADSVGVDGARRPLLDNNMYLVPGVRVAASRGGDDRGAFALSEAVLAIDGAAIGGDPVHVQLYSYGEVLGRGLRKALGGLPDVIAGVPGRLLGRIMVGFVYLSGADSVRASARVVAGDRVSRIQVESSPGERSAELLQRVLRMMRRHGRTFGFVPLTYNRTGLGFSGHLCGTMPMRPNPGPLDTHRDGRVEGSRALYAVDASTFPMLPAQNPTYTAMANAHRIATAWAVRMRDAALARVS